MNRHRQHLDAMCRAVLDEPAELAPGLRQAAARNRDLPEPLRDYVDKVARHAYRVTDEEVAALRRAYSDDQLFELTIAAALGAALRRIEAGLAPLGEAAAGPEDGEVAGAALAAD